MENNDQTHQHAIDLHALDKLIGGLDKSKVYGLEHRDGSPSGWLIAYDVSIQLYEGREVKRWVIYKVDDVEGDEV